MYVCVVSCALRVLCFGGFVLCCLVVVVVLVVGFFPAHRKAL